MTDIEISCYSKSMVRNKESGQALLIVVLVMIIALTVGLSVASRSIVNLRTSTEDSDSQKALSAAESGVEQAIKINNSTTISGSFPLNQASYNTTINEVKDTTSFLVNGGNSISQDDGIDIWLVPHKADGTPDYSSTWGSGSQEDLTIYWGNSPTSCDNPALEIAIITSPNVLTRYTFDPCKSRTNTGTTPNHFDQNANPGIYNIEGKTLYYKVTIKNITDGLIARVVPIYASTPIGVEGSINFPSQGFNIDSTGTSATAKHTIIFFKAYDQLSSQYFLYGLFSP